MTTVRAIQRLFGAGIISAAALAGLMALAPFAEARESSAGVQAWQEMTEALLHGEFDRNAEQPFPQEDALLEDTKADKTQEAQVSQNEAKGKEEEEVKENTAPEAQEKETPAQDTQASSRQETAASPAAREAGSFSVPLCPFSPSASRQVLDFNGGLARSEARVIGSASDDNPQEISGALSAEPGVYRLRTFSWDGYENRVNVSQPHEQWRVALYDAQSELIAEAGPTPDLADNRSQASVKKNFENIAVTRPVATIRAVHAYPSDKSANSVVPVCVALIKTGEVSIPEEPTEPADPENPGEPSEPRNAGNLVANGTFEAGTQGNPVNWNKGFWGTHDATFTYPISHGNGKAAEVRITSYTSGDAKWFFPRMVVKGGTQLVYENEYLATVPTVLSLEYAHADGSLSYGWLGNVPASSSWKKQSFTFTVPADVVALTVFHSLSAVGTLAIDNVALTEKASTPAKKAVVSLSFDDGWLSQYTNAAPLLEKHGMRGTFYYTTQYLNANTYPGFMTRAQLKALHAKGHEIGAHTITHRDLATLSTKEMNKELKNSKKTLENVIKAPVRSMAYPYGAYNDTVLARTKAAGYTNARAAWGGQVNTSASPFALSAFLPTAHTPMQETKASIDAAVADGAWLILGFHEIDTNGREYAHTPAELEEILVYLKQKGVDVKTVDAAFAERF